MFEGTVHQAKERWEPQLHRNPDERHQNEEAEAPPPHCLFAVGIERHCSTSPYFDLRIMVQQAGHVGERCS